MAPRTRSLSEKAQQQKQQQMRPTTKPDLTIAKNSPSGKIRTSTDRSATSPAVAALAKSLTRRVDVLVEKEIARRGAKFQGVLVQLGMLVELVKKLKQESRRDSTDHYYDPTCPAYA
eukprot:5087340-Pleurochrysis_carterae.AAC.1